MEQDRTNIEEVFSSDGSQGLQLVGAPYANVQSTCRQLSEDDAYQMLEIPFVPAGDYILRVCLKHDNGLDMLQFSMMEKHGRALVTQSILPICYDIGSRCVLYDVSREETGEVVKGMYAQLLEHSQKMGRTPPDMGVPATTKRKRPAREGRNDPTFVCKAKNHGSNSAENTPSVRTRAMARQDNEQGGGMGLLNNEEADVLRRYLDHPEH